MSCYQGHDDYFDAVAEASTNFFSPDIDAVWVCHKEKGGKLSEPVFRQTKLHGWGNCPSCGWPGGQGHHEKCQTKGVPITI